MDETDRWADDGRTPVEGTRGAPAPCPECRLMALVDGVCRACGYRALADAERADDLTDSDDLGVLFMSLDDAAQSATIKAPAPTMAPARIEAPARTEARARTVPGYSVCPRCGWAAGPQPPRRCEPCGYPLQFLKRKSADADAAIRCGQCGMRNAPSAPVCVNCGRRLAQD